MNRKLFISIASCRAGLKEGEKGYGSLYTYTYVQIYREMKAAD